MPGICGNSLEYLERLSFSYTGIHDGIPELGTCFCYLELIRRDTWDTPEIPGPGDTWVDSCFFILNSFGCIAQYQAKAVLKGKLPTHGGSAFTQDLYPEGEVIFGGNFICICILKLPLRGPKHLTDTGCPV